MDNSIVPGKELKAMVIGVGGMGASALEHIGQSDLASLSLAAVHTHARVLQNRNIAQKILVGMDRTHGLGSGGDPELARAMGEKDRETLEELCTGVDLLFLVAGLGGGTGSGLSPVIASIAKKAGALVIGVATLPFEFEGQRRARQAQVGLQNLRASSDAVICLPNEKITQLLTGHTTIIEAFQFTNELLAQGIRGIWQMLTRPGLINVDFAYLYSVLRGRHVESALATAEATGENRSRMVVESLLQNPLMDGGNSLGDADDVLVSLSGGSDLTIAEINKIMEQLNRHIEKGQLILGTAVDPALEGRLLLTVIAAKHAKGAMHAETEMVESPQRNASLKAPGDFDTSFFDAPSSPRAVTRFLPPPPTSTPERTEELLQKQPAKRGTNSKWKQGMLALEIVSRGRFEKSEPTIHRGADLDVPTYIRRGVPLN